MRIAHRVLVLVLVAGCTPQSRDPDPARVEPDAAFTIALHSAEPSPHRRPPIDGTSLDAISLPLTEMRANAIYMPDPDVDDIERPLVGIVPFCVGMNGKPTYVETPSTGDAGVDIIFRKVVASWRFTPFVVHGIARKVCSAAEFRIGVAIP